jgi:hypothetical protein
MSGASGMIFSLAEFEGNIKLSLFRLGCKLKFYTPNQNKKFFYQWDGAGLRYEIQEFVSCIFNHRQTTSRLRQEESITMAQIMQDFIERKNVMEI